MKRKKKIQTSNWEKKSQPIIRPRIISVKRKVSFKNNDNYLADRKEFDRLFKINKIEQPMYFKKLANNLKNKNRVSEILEYAKMYLRGKTIKEIEALQKVPKKIKPAKPPAWIVKK